MVQYTIGTDPDAEGKLKKQGLQLANVGGGSFTGAFIDPGFKGGRPFRDFKRRQGKAEETIKGDVADATAGVGQEFRDLKYRLKGMRDAEGNLVQSEGFALQQAEMEAKRDRDLAAAQTGAQGATSRAMATQSMFGSSGGGARSRSEAQQAGVAQAGQQATRAASTQQIGQAAAEDLQLQKQREQSYEDQLIAGAQAQQQAFGTKSDLTRAAADMNKADINWERNIAATNVAQMNQMELAKLGMRSQLSAAGAQAAATTFGGFMNFGAGAMSGGMGSGGSGLPAGSQTAYGSNYSPYTV